LGSTCLSTTIDSQIGIRELTGKNDGKEILKYQKATGNKKGDPYCASFVKWCFDQCGIKTTITAFSPSAFNRKNIVYYKHKFTKEPKEGDVFCLWVMSKGRIGHTGFFRKKVNSRMYYTTEGNTSEGSSFGPSDYEGQGVYRKIRSFNTTYCISRW